MPLLDTLVDTFPSLDTTVWSVNGAGVLSGGLHVNCAYTSYGTQYAFARTPGQYTFVGSQLVLEVPSMPAPGDPANAQFWVSDPNPDSIVARIGFEYVAEQNRLDLIGQSGPRYTPIGSTTRLTYDPTLHRWLRIRHGGSRILWDTSPDGFVWTTRRTLTTVPTWTRKTTLRVSIEGFRSDGSNDSLRVDNLGVVRSALPTDQPAGVDALQRRTLGESRTWQQWLTTNNARGWVGEFNGVTVFGRYGDTAQQAQWDALLEAYLTDLDVAGVSGTVWASGREWGNGYPLGVHVGVNVGDPLTQIQSNAAQTVAAHPTRGAGLNQRWRGVNLSGWEAGININGGGTVRSSAGYVHTGADFAYLASAAVDTVRLPVAWERLQPTLSAALSTSALASLDAMVASARQWGIRLIVDLHNYGRYTRADGSIVALGGGLSNAQFTDFWTRLAAWVRADTRRSQSIVGYGLMNEPHDLTGGSSTWQSASQAAVTAIRQAGDTRLLLVGGYQFSSLTSWAANHPTSWITDPANNYCYEAHHYWDTQSVLGSRSGTYQQSKAGGGTEILTYATELAAADAAENPPGPPTVTAAGTINMFYGIV